MGYQTRIDSHTVLDSKKRLEIYTYIKNNPGKHLNGLSRELKMSYGTIEYHIRCLKKYNIIRVKKDKHYDHYYAVNHCHMKEEKKNEYKTLDRQIVELWNSCGMKVMQERFYLDTWVITADIIDQKNKFIDYKIIEQKIRELWKSRGMNVHSIKFQPVKNEYASEEMQWTIIADRKK